MKNNKLHLLFVIDSFASGGAQRQMVSLALELSSRGHVIEFLVYHPADFFESELDQANIKIHLAQKKRRFSMKPLWGIRRLSRSRAFDLILSYQTTANLYAILSQRFSRNKKPVVISERSGFDFVKNSIKHKLIFKFYRYAHRVICNSYHLKNNLLQKMNWEEKKVVTIWNGINLNKFQFTDIAAQYSEHKFIAIGTPMPFKQWTCLIDAMAILKDQFNLKIHVTWLGRTENLCPIGSAYYEQMQQKIKEHGLEQQWNWGGREKDISAVLANHIGLIHPSVLEGLPNVICEALACGRPVIASNMLDHPRLIQDNKSGYLFEPKSAQSLAEAIQKLCNLSEDELCDMSKAARKFAEENLSIKSLGDNYEQLFCDLTEGKK